ncbi:imelysin family protein [Algihabitans albus]|uniref:imelysin family protein n=1 Tax=Algihabitans albus TaxID=2164067 RepID=UPI002E253748
MRAMTAGATGAAAKTARATRYGFLAGGALLVASLLTAAAGKAAEPAAVLDTYADIAQAGYEDSLITARTLRATIEALVEAPSEETLMQARAAWLAARIPYQQTEVYRFGNEIVDDWEGRVNAWPLDEGLIDYVEGDYGTESDENLYYAVNVVANSTLTVGGRSIDATAITPTLLSDVLHEADEVEANVATGYHAIEFLLWGQDLNGTGPGAGTRPATDFDMANCSNGNCDRRAEYLVAVTDLLLADLEEMVEAWGEDGEARAALTAQGEDAGLIRILTGLGSLSYGELAGERMRLGLLLHDPEEEHDCFADNTHNSHFYNVVGMINVVTGTYRRIDGTRVSGPGLEALLADADPTVAGELRAGLERSYDAALDMVHRAERVENYDQMIAAGNDEGNATIEAVIQALVDQTRSIERAVAALDLQPIAFEGSDSLDNPNAVFQ